MKEASDLDPAVAKTKCLCSAAIFVPALVILPPPARPLTRVPL